jgi:hypothetical protein
LGRQPDGSLVSEADREALTHEQCLAVLDVLEKEQQQAAAVVQKQQAERKIDYIRLPELVKKMETSAPIRTEDLVCALYYELEELKQRIEELERNGNHQA